MIILFVLLGFFAIGAGLAIIFKGIPAFTKLAFQIFKLLYGIFILLPMQLVRVIQGKPAVPPKNEEP